MTISTQAYIYLVRLLLLAAHLSWHNLLIESSACQVEGNELGVQCFNVTSFECNVEWVELNGCDVEPNKCSNIYPSVALLFTEYYVPKLKVGIIG